MDTVLVICALVAGSSAVISLIALVKMRPSHSKVLKSFTAAQSASRELDVALERFSADVESLADLRRGSTRSGWTQSIEALEALAEVSSADSPRQQHLVVYWSAKTNARAVINWNDAAPFVSERRTGGYGSISVTDLDFLRDTTAHWARMADHVEMTTDTEDNVIPVDRPFSTKSTWTNKSSDPFAPTVLAH